jgi:NIPSNAP
MIVEERCYTLKPGTVALYYQDYDPRGLRIQKRILGNLIGYFHTEIGELNQVVHLWGYDSLAERERRRALLAADPEWQDYLKQSPDIIVKMENTCSRAVLAHKVAKHPTGPRRTSVIRRTTPRKAWRRWTYS